MISGLTFDYAQARACARLSQRPDDRLWGQLRTSRSVPALLEVVRGSSAAALVSGIPVAGSADDIELAFRQQLRTRIAEVAAWSPVAWRPALLYTRYLVDLPALLHLLSAEPPPRWISADPALAPYALGSLAQRRAALAESPVAPLVGAIAADSEPHRPVIPRAGPRHAQGGRALHRLLAAWETEWHRQWPRTNDEEGSALEALVRTLSLHVLRFASVPVEDAAGARQTLGAHLASIVRRSALQPAALFAYLALFAVDLERLRAEFMQRARPVRSFG